MFSPGREEEERARARAEEAYTSQLRELQSLQADEEEGGGVGDEVKTGWPDGRSHRPNIGNLGDILNLWAIKIC